MKSFIFHKLALFISTLFLMSVTAWGGEPTEQLKASISEFVTILTNTPVAELRARGLPENARRLVFGRFDFSEMTQRSLGPHWKSLDLEEQREFVDAFTQRLLVFTAEPFVPRAVRRFTSKAKFKKVERQRWIPRSSAAMVRS
jgi:ABC-type transporter MlaC component